MWGATASDWLDGPVARRNGTAGSLGRFFDLEADTLLTLCASAAGVAWGGLPRWFTAAPTLRYLLPFIAARRSSYERADLGGTWWARTAGTAQMVVLGMALAPFGDRLFRPAVTILAKPVAISQVAALAVLGWRLVSSPSGPRGKRLGR